MYFELVFFTDVWCHKTSTNLVPVPTFSFIFPYFHTLHISRYMNWTVQKLVALGSKMTENDFFYPSFSATQWNSTRCKFEQWKESQSLWAAENTSNTVQTFETNLWEMQRELSGNGVHTYRGTAGAYAEIVERNTGNHPPCAHMRVCWSGDVGLMGTSDT